MSPVLSHGMSFLQVKVYCSLRRCPATLHLFWKRHTQSQFPLVIWWRRFRRRTRCKRYSSWFIGVKRLMSEDVSQTFTDVTNIDGVDMSEKSDGFSCIVVLTTAGGCDLVSVMGAGYNDVIMLMGFIGRTQIAEVRDNMLSPVAVRHRRLI